MIHRAPGRDHGVRPDLSVDMLPEQVTEALRIRRDADVIPLDENGEAIVEEDRPQPWDLIADGHDLQLHTALVLLQTQHESIASQRAAWNPNAEPVRIP
jgi:plasmid stability protein